MNKGTKIAAKNMSEGIEIKSGAIVAVGVVGLGDYSLYKWLRAEKIGGYEPNVT